MTRLGFSRSLRGSALAIVLVAGVALFPAQAIAESAPPSVESGFGYWESDTFEDVYNSITRTNAPDVAAAILREAEEGASWERTLDHLNAGDRAEVLEAAAASAAADAPLPAETAELSANVSVLDTWGLGSPILGQPIANGFSWQHKDRYYWAHCETFGENCVVEDWIDFTYTVDPGGSGTRLTVSTLTWGERITGHRVDAIIYRGAQQIRIKDGPDAGRNGTYVVWLSPHLSLTGYTFTAAMQTSVTGPELNGDAGVFRTGPTSTCTEPDPGAWRCIFLN